MRFYIISDLHIDEAINKDKVNRILTDLCKKIRTEVSVLEQILFIILGDIVNAGDINGFDTARDFLKLIREQLKDFSVNFEFVPGNHDASYGDIGAFDTFTSEFGSAHSFKTSGTYSKVYAGVNFIFADSVRHRVHNMPGKIDVDSIELEVKKDVQNILFCHHAIAQGHGGSHDTLENSVPTLKKLHNISINFVFHGHTHRADAELKIAGIVEIGCGSLFSEDSWLHDEEIQNQFTVGSIRDGKIVEVGRYIISRDGSDIFPYSTLYPTGHTFVDPDTVGKLEYKPVTYISRKIYPHSFSLENPVVQILSAERGCSLFDALVKEHNVLLLSDAGMGKSIELQHLAYKLYDSPFFPLLYNLRNYSGEKIEELLPPEYKGLAHHRKALLFDGYDELPKEQKRIFEGKLNYYVEQNPQAYIVISSRRNFCSTTKDNKSQTFHEFKVYDLWKLSDDDIDDYLAKECINKRDILLQATAANLRDLLFNPFYLVEMVSLYNKYRKLPSKAELMKCLIAESFNSDDAKFSGELDERYYNFWSLLKKLAFSMQLMQKSTLDDRSEYQVLLENSEDRALIKHCGILQKTGFFWSFYHNNFREYLSAEYLSALPEQTVKSLVASEFGIKPSWINTLGFLADLPLDWNLIGWLAEFCPEALVKCEPDRVSSALRYEVFKRIFLNHEAEGLWFDDEYCTEAELAQFSASNESLTFLIDRIKSPVHIRSQHTAINVLRHFPTGLYGRRKEVLDCLLYCCDAFPRIESHTCRLAIYAIAQLNLNTLDVTDRLISSFSTCSDDYIRLGMYEYLIQSKEHDRHVQFFLNGIQYIDSHIGNSNRVGNEQFELELGLKTISKPESIIDVLRWYGSKNRPAFFGDDKILEAILCTAENLYNSGQTSLLGEVFNCFIKTQLNLDFEFAKSFADFFKHTNTESTVSLLALESVANNEHGFSYIIHTLPNALKYVLDAYAVGEYNNHEKFKTIVQLHAHGPLYIECAEVIKARTGVILPNQAPTVDYDALRYAEQQKYFNSLFSLEDTEVLLHTLLKNIGEPTVKVGELLEFHPDLTEHHCAWNRLKIAIYHNGNPNWHLSEFFNKVNFDCFSIIQLERILTQNANTYITNEQYDVLKSKVIHYLETGDLSAKIHHKENTTTINLFFSSLVSLAYHFNLRMSESVLLDMIEVPAYCFGEKQGIANKYGYLKSHISEEKILERISKNISANKLGNTLLQDHIQICADLKCNAAESKAIELCISCCSDTWLRSTALNYLYTLYGEDYICCTLLPYADGPFILEIINICKESNRDDIFLALEREFNKEPSLPIMEQLLKRKSKIAFKYYVEIVEEKRHPPEYHNEHRGDPTKAIENIADQEALPLFKRLIDVVFSPDFEDNNFFTLRSSLGAAIINCGTNAPTETLALIKSYLVHDVNESHKFFCNYIVKEIKKAQKKLLDKPLSVLEAKSLTK